MRRLTLLFLVAGLVVSLVAVSHFSLCAQSETPQKGEKQLGHGVFAVQAKLLPRDSVQDALLKPYHFRFPHPTPLADVAQRLGLDLGLPVVLDLAALDRLDIKPEDTVKLELEGVRLKTGLKLLLDQVGLTYKVVAEDNLLILTDKQGSEDPIERVMAEIHELHRDIHDIQDALDEVRELTGLSGAEGARVAQADHHRGDARKPGCQAAGRRHVQAFDAAGARLETAGPSVCPATDQSVNRPSHSRAPTSMQPGSKTSGAGDGETGHSESDSDGGLEPGTGKSRSRSRRDALAESRNWLREPRTTVLIVLGGVVLLGGGRRLLQAWQARKAVARLGEPNITPGELESVAQFGRSGLPELFRIFGEPPSASLRDAAGRAISVLWAHDQLIAEEEQALVRRGYTVEWVARRRYPRALKSEIPIRAMYGLLFLRSDGPGIKPADLEWSHRITGARRAALEEYSVWTPGAGNVEFAIVPSDFDSNGPHRLALQTRVRTRGLTDSWQIDLPHLPFNFEFDPRLETHSLLTLPDEHRAERIARSVRLESQQPSADERSSFLALNQEMMIRNPPELVIATPIPCDLAHKVFLEFDQVPGRFPAGLILLSGQGDSRSEGSEIAASTRRFPIGPVEPILQDAIDQPGSRRLRVWLEPDPDRGWTDPDVRSIWPGTIETGWISLEIVRR